MSEVRSHRRKASPDDSSPEKETEASESGSAKRRRTGKMSLSEAGRRGAAARWGKKLPGGQKKSRTTKKGHSSSSKSGARGRSASPGGRTAKRGNAGERSASAEGQHKSKGQDETIENESDKDSVTEKQNKKYYEALDALKSAHNNRKITKEQLLHLLEFNNAQGPSGDAIYKELADIMAFGAKKRCPECKNGLLSFRIGVGYICTGMLNDQDKCSYRTYDPPRVPFKAPKELHDVDLIRKYITGKTEKRYIPEHAPPESHDASKLKPYHGPKTRENPLEHFRFYVDPEVQERHLDQKLRAFGGRVSKSVNPKNGKVAVIVSTTENLESGEADFVDFAKEHSIPVVSPLFYDALDQLDFNLVDVIEENLICDWVDRSKILDHLQAINPEFHEPDSEPLKIERGGTKPMVTSILDVDPLSYLGKKAHVYMDGDTCYSVILSKVDVEAGINKYYKLQVLESNSEPKKYWMFRSWGRYGTTIGNHKCDEMSRDSAVALFHTLFEEKTRNKYGAKFVTKEGHYIPIKFEEHEGTREKLKPDPKASKLPMPVQTFISKVFDVELMKQTLLEYKMDVKEIPLGQIKLEQILEAYKTLSDLITELKKEKPDRNHVVHLTNHFYTLIPHNFGNEDIEILDNIELVQSKATLLENLIEIDTAYDVLVESKTDEESPIDARYHALDCDIKVVDKKSQLWKQLERYLQNTHAPSHSDYTMEVLNICKADRADESKRFKKYEKLHRMLLWHGSRISNIAGIMCQGLRIAPMAAPPSGYLYGKGIYFTDCSSKAANFCHATRRVDSAFLLLCDVAVGESFTMTRGDSSLVKPPENKDSVFAPGRMQPNPNDTFTTPAGALVPFGKLIETDIDDTDLNYDEYIIFEEDQVKIDYIVEVKFHFKSA